MFLLNEMLVVSRGRRQEAMERLAWIHGLMASKPGFRRAIVARYLGDEQKHAVLRVWDDEGAHQRFREGPDGNYGRSRPPGLYTNEQVVPQWESIVEARGSGEGSYLVMVHQEVPEASWEAWLAYQKRLHEFRQAQGGLHGVWTFRAKGRSESLSIARYHARGAHQRLVDSAEFLKAMEGEPEGVKRLSVQQFEVVSDTPPAS